MPRRLQHAGPKVLDDNVSVRGEGRNERDVLAAIEIRGHTPFVAVDTQEIRAFTPVVERRTPAAAVISGARPLYFYNICT